MKVLMLTPYLPFPLMSGGQTRSYNLIKNLSKEHEITLFSLIKHDQEKKHIGELEKFCSKVRVFKRSESPWTLRNIFLTGFSPFPFLVIRNLSPQERRSVRQELAQEKYDLIHAETFYVMPHIPKTEVPVLLVDQTVEYLVYKHFVEEQAAFFLRPLLWIDVLKMRFWETHFWQRAKRVVAMSDSDKETMSGLVKNLKVNIVPNGIDIDYFSEKKRRTPKQAKVLYVGNFTWMQNVEAAEILARRVWPKIKQTITDAQLWIVGRSITEEIKALAREKDIQVTESLPDIRDAYTQTTVLVAPIKGPGGTRLKILEAMASSLPVVTTPVGAEGLGVKNGREALISKKPEKLADYAIKVIENQKLAQRLGSQGKKFVKENYSWQQSANLLEEIYQELVYGK